MSRPQWVQPALDGGAVQRAIIDVRWVYGVGWCGSCKIRQEGRVFNELLEVSRLTDGTTEDLETWLRLVTRFVGGY